MTMKSTRACVLAALALGAVAVAIQPGEAHKAITSKYTYNDDVFPILRDRCASCHVPGGVAPMSLMTYDDAFPWAESIRAELVAAHMPPWNAEEGYGEIKRAHTLTPKELDVILTWATGGNPRGSLDQTLPAVTLNNDWKLGAPDLPLTLPAEFTLAADKMEDWQEFTLPTGTTEARWVRAVDLRPGTPSIVRSATIVVKNAGAASGATTTVPEQVLALWLPGQDPAPADDVVFRLPAGAQLGVRIHYKKTWQFEGKALTDRSTVGVYFSRGGAAGGAQELFAWPIDSPASAPSGADQTIRFSRTLAEDVRALALSPDKVPGNISLQVEAVKPDGSRVPMIRINTRADWDRRYWFEKPMALPRGTRVEVTANLQDPDMLSAAFTSTPGATAAPARTGAMRLTLNVIPARSKAGVP
jgi:mono/diheme cytochrome c family protein